MAKTFTLPNYEKGVASVYDHCWAHERALTANWRNKKNYPTVLTREKIHPALHESGFGTIDLDGLGIQRVRDLHAAEKFADHLESLPTHNVHWPIKEWMTRGVSIGNEVYVVKDRYSSSAVGFIGFKREMEYEDFDALELHIIYDLSAIYVSPNYSGMGCATALFHPLITDLQMTLDFVKATWRGLSTVTGRNIVVDITLTGEAYSSGGAGCGASLFRAMEKAVDLEIKRSRRSGLCVGDAIDFFDYGMEEDWRDLTIDFERSAA